MQNIIIKMDPTMLFLATTLLFAATIAAGGFLFHEITCAINSKTAMNGVMQMQVFLCEGADGPRLSCGEYFIGMADPEELKAVPFYPALSWKERAELRRYPVKVFLARYLRAIRGTLGQDDPICNLIWDLLRRGGFCDDLGSVSCRNARKGLRTTASASEKDKRNANRLKIFGEIPRECSDIFLQATQCRVTDMCITLEYLERSSL